MSFEYGVTAAAFNAGSVLGGEKRKGEVGERERRLNHQSSQMQSSKSLSQYDLVKMTQINILYLNQTKINGSLSELLSPTVTRQARVGQNQH